MRYLLVSKNLLIKPVYFAFHISLSTCFSFLRLGLVNPVLERLKSLPARNERRMTKMFEDLKAVGQKYEKIASEIPKLGTWRP
jgi:hypothetical protein